MSLNRVTTPLQLRDPEQLFDFYCWANWCLDPDEWIQAYEPTVDDWRDFIEATIDESVEESTLFYLWAAGRMDTYHPRQNHLEKFIALSN